MSASSSIGSTRSSELPSSIVREVDSVVVVTLVLGLISSGAAAS
jgi:hypothetical protein